MQVFTHIGAMITLGPPAQSSRLTNLVAADLGKLGPDAWLAVDSDGKTLAVGQGAVPAAYAKAVKTDLGGRLVIPGLVDSHSHLLFAGSRANEFWQRASGATYQEIAAQGGGIRSSMTATRQASDEQLHSLLEARLKRALSLGITTLEIKTGYGLSVAEELRLLRVLQVAQKRTPQQLHITCLALHAASPESATLADYVQKVTTELLPQIAAEGLATSVDAFIEAGYFSVKDTEPYALRARELGLKLRLHADEFTDAGGAAAAAAWGAQSADHLQFASDAGVAAMAKAKVTATLLPGTSLYTKIPFTQARRFADAGVPVALATDLNPGSCLIDNLAMLATLASVQSGFRPAEAIAAVTLVPAVSLGFGGRKGALAAGYDADFLVYELGSAEDWLADFGRTPPRGVYVRGELKA